MAPMVLWLFAFVVAPTVILFVYSFCQRDELGQIVYAFSWDNYRRIFIDSDTGEFGATYLTVFVRSVSLCRADDGHLPGWPGILSPGGSAARPNGAAICC